MVETKRSGSKEEEFRPRTKTGEIHYGRVSAVRVSINGRPRMLSVTHDITDRKCAAETGSILN